MGRFENDFLYLHLGICESVLEFTESFRADARWRGDLTTTTKHNTKEQQTTTIHHSNLPDDTLGFVFSVCDKNSVVSQQTKWVEFFCAFLIGVLCVLVSF